MSLLSRPLGNSVRRPVAAAITWGVVSLAAVVVVTAVVGAIAVFVAWVASLLGRGDFEWPVDLVRGVAAVLGPLTVASSTWAAAYASTNRVPAGRALLATLGGIALLAVLVRVAPGVALVSAAGLAWSVAMPFERWERLLLRIALPAAAATGVGVTLPEPGTAAVIVTVVAAYPAAGLLVWVGDAAWNLTRRSRRDDPD